MAGSQYLQTPALRIARLLATVAGCLMTLMASQPLWAEQLPAQAAAKGASVVVKLSSIDSAYADAKFVMELAGDQEGYQILKETVDLFLGGVNTGKPCFWRVFATPDGLLTVSSLPVATMADLNAFLQYLWDVDLKTAPPPKSGLTSHVPPTIRAKLKSLNLPPNERLFFSLTDGFLRHDAGYVHLGESLDAVRLPWSDAGKDTSSSTVMIRVIGTAATPDLRRAAFEKSREKALLGLKQDEQESAATFALRKSLLAHQYTASQLLISESSQVALGWKMSHEKRQSDVHAEVTPVAGTSLATNIQRIGQSVDVFAGVSSQNAVLAGSFNVPIEPTLGKSLKSVVPRAREFVRDWLDRAGGPDAALKAVDWEFAELVFDVAEEVAAMTDFNGCVRTWSNGDGNLTTVGAIRIGNGQVYQDRVTKLKNREAVVHKSSAAKIEIHKISVHRWREEYAELFDRDGAVFVGIAKDRIWYAAGDKALGRLEQAIQEAERKSDAKSNTAIELQAQLQSLTEVWGKIHLRRHPDEGKKREKKSTEKKPTIAKSVSIISSLDLPKLAAEAYQKGPDTMIFSLKRDGEKAILTAQFDAGTLRFVGKALSKFVKDYLE